MRIERCPLDGVLIIELDAAKDARGAFVEAWRDHLYRHSGIGPNFTQDNFAITCFGALRGMHAQNPSTQGKLVSVWHGAVWDVVVDIRRSSSTFGQWFGLTLSAENMKQLWIPPGFAHGFVSLSENSLFHYKCTESYSPKKEIGFKWDDQQVGIEWPIFSPILSERDANALPFSVIP